VFETTLHSAICDDEQRWHFLDAEALREVAPLIHIDLTEDEGAVVFAPLQHLRDVALDTPASTVELGVEEDEPRARLRGLLDGPDSLA
jgi:hypothetical protein